MNISSYDLVFVAHHLRAVILSHMSRAEPGLGLVMIVLARVQDEALRCAFRQTGIYHFSLAVGGVGCISLEYQVGENFKCK